MSPLNSKNSQIFTLQQNKTILQSQFTNVQLSFLFFFYVLSIFLKNVRSFLSLFFLCVVFNSVKYPFLSSLSFSIVLYLFFKIINCSFNNPFFKNLISASLCLYLNSITIGSLPRLFNFNP